MTLALLVALLGSAAAPAPSVAARLGDDDPAIKVWLNHDAFYRGDKARVNVKTAEDGYVVVLRVDGEGRVRVLFPLDPSNDNFVRGGETIEVRSRGDREAFFVDERDGEGLVLAARSASPFKFDEFVRGDHWDYRVLDARSAGDDKESALVDIVQKMSAEGHFDYDAARYIVGTERQYSHYASPGWGWGGGYGWGWSRFGSCYDPYFYDPFDCGWGWGYYSPYAFGYYNPYFYNPYAYGFGFSFIYRPYYGLPYVYYRPFTTYGVGNQPYNLFVNKLRPGTGPGLVFKNPQGSGPGLGGIAPRWRGPPTTLFAGNAGTQTRAVPTRERDWNSATPIRNDPFDVRRADRPTRGDRPTSRSGSSASGSDRRSPQRVHPDGGWGEDRGSSSAASRGERSTPSNSGGSRSSEGSSGRRSGGGGGSWGGGGSRSSGGGGGSHSSGGGGGSHSSGGGGGHSGGGGGGGSHSGGGGGGGGGGRRHP